MIKGDYHTHTNASDGRSPMKDNIRRAIELGLKEIAITEHSFGTLLCHLTYPKFDFEKVSQELKNRENEIRILVGVEGNLLNARGDMDVPADVIPHADILQLGFHRFLQPKHLKGNLFFVLINGFAPRKKRETLVEVNTEAYLSAMDRYPIDVLVHLNHRALVDVKRVAEKAKEKNVYVELNEKHISTLERDIDVLVDSGVNFILGSDAHETAKIGKFDKVMKFAEKHGIPNERIYGRDKLPTFKNKSEYRNEQR